MVAYVHNGYGNPVRNVVVYYQYNGSEYRAVSSSSGYANATFPIKYINQIQVHVNYTYTSFGNKIETPSVAYTINTQMKYSGLEIYPGIFNVQNSSRIGALAIYVGENGSSSPYLSFIFFATNSSKGIPNTFYAYYYNFTLISIEKIYPQLHDLTHSKITGGTSRSSHRHLYSHGSVLGNYSYGSNIRSRDIIK
ncbi:MAG: hypothetical protein ACP5TO_01535 [Thermoplasmata archaeon]